MVYYLFKNELIDLGFVLGCYL